MSIGRNEPCPCGSGKKYKHCCWRKDRAATHQFAPAAPFPDLDGNKEAEEDVADLFPERDPVTSIGPLEAAALEEAPPSPWQVAMDQFWDEFDDAGYEERMVMVETTLRETPAVFDVEMTFEVFVLLYDQAADADERPRFDALVALLQQQAPEAYEHEKHYLLGWRIENALATNDRTEIPVLFTELATTAGEQIDEFNRAKSALVYHGELDALVSGVRRAWPHVKDSEKVVPWGIDEFAAQAADYELFALLEQKPGLVASDPELLARLEVLIDPNQKNLERYLGHLTGRLQPEWTEVNLTLAPVRQRHNDWVDEEEDEEPDPAQANLHWLTVAFLRYWHEAEGVSYTKGDLARTELHHYLLKRHAGELEGSDLLPSMPRGGWRRPKRKKRRRRRHQVVPLCPDRKTLDRRLSQLIGLLSGQYFAAGALFESIPAWLRFLEKHELIDAAQREQTLRELKGLADDWHMVVTNHTAHPLLQVNATQWEEKAGLLP